MTRVQSNPHFNKEQKKVFSIIHSIAKMNKTRQMRKYVARFRQFTNPFRFHEDNINTVLKISKELKSGEGLNLFALEARDIIIIINNKKNAL